MSTHRAIPKTLTVPGGKIGGYLLNLDHPSGSSKAKFFLSLGFNAEDPAGFVNAIFEHVDNRDTDTTFVDTGGLTKMVCEGPFRTPSGQWTRIRSVWVMTGANDAQFVTAIPARDRPRNRHGP